MNIFTRNCIFHCSVDTTAGQSLPYVPGPIQNWVPASFSLGVDCSTLSGYDIGVRRPLVYGGLKGPSCFPFRQQGYGIFSTVVYKN